VAKVEFLTKNKEKVIPSSGLGNTVAIVFAVSYLSYILVSRYLEGLHEEEQEDTKEGTPNEFTKKLKKMMNLTGEGNKFCLYCDLFQN